MNEKREILRLLMEKDFVKARERLGKIDWEKLRKYDKGYLTALRGMLKALERKDRRFFINRLEEEELNKVLKSFEETKKIHRQIAPEDIIGFLDAWIDYLRERGMK